MCQIGFPVGGVKSPSTRPGFGSGSGGEYSAVKCTNLGDESMAPVAHRGSFVGHFGLRQTDPPPHNHAQCSRARLQMNTLTKRGPDKVHFAVHVIVCYLVFLPWFVHPTVQWDIVRQLSLVGPIALGVIGYSVWALIGLYFLIVFLTRKSWTPRLRTFAAIGAVALSFAGAFCPDWLLYQYSHNIDIAPFLPSDEMFLPPGEVERFKQAFGTPAVEWSKSGAVPGTVDDWLTVPRDRYSPSMEAFLRREAGLSDEPGGAGSRSRSVGAETKRTSEADNPLPFFGGVASFIALMALIWRVSLRPRWRVRAVIYGWGLCIVWALLWALVLPWLFRGRMDSRTFAATFPDGAMVLAALAFGWVWPLLVVGTAAYCHRDD